ncbi:MAG: AraC family transcriptional regulator [Bacteroidaceae bacterium]|nr:AraC family transcriptional regulator [Bacteroidaceae bacterium]
MKNHSQKPTLHPVVARNKDIEERGILIIEDVSNPPATAEPFVSPHLVIVLCHRGYSRGEYDMNPIEFRAHDYSVVFPEHPIQARETSADYLSTLIIISESLYEEFRPRLAYGNNQIFHSHPCFHLDDAQYRCICNTIELLKSLLALNLACRKVLMANTIDLLSKQSNCFRQAAADGLRAAGGQETVIRHSLFGLFYDLLARHYRQHRDVAFYARQLCLSPKYFGTLIKKDIGISAGQCIARYVAIQAKSMLLHRPDLNIQQIGYQLGFDDCTAFSRYFKSSVGCSPREYRKME